jgi:riboflavin kinase/FMN adenylyltransferase
MQLFYASEDWRSWLTALPRLAGQSWPHACVATIGNFDGLHLGHRALVGSTVARARELGLPSLAISFEPHPARLFGREFLPLQTLGQRLQALAQSGLDAVLLLPFTRDFATMEGADFSRDVLAAALCIRELFLGYDFRMGRDRAGTEQLAEYGQEHGYAVSTLGAVLHQGLAVSSSRIREALARGDLTLANAMLGRAHSVRGVVEHGYGRGGPLLGFPTANQNITAQVMPCPAVYATLARLPGKAGREDFAPGAVYELAPVVSSDAGFAAMTSFGRNPTFGANRLCLESHILDFQRDIYDCVLDLSFLEKMRSEQAFSGPDALKVQLRADLEQRRSLGSSSFC